MFMIVSFVRHLQIYSSSSRLVLYVWVEVFLDLQSSLLNTDIKGTQQIVHTKEVSLLHMTFGLFKSGPSELSVIERCLYYRGVRRARFDCICFAFN